MRRFALAVALWFSCMCACVRPSFPQGGSSSPPTLCQVAQRMDLVVIATPTRVLDPELASASVWPGKTYWVTPIEWQLQNVLYSSPAAPTTVQASFRTVMGSSSPPSLSGRRIIGLKMIDGQWYSDIIFWLSETSSGWSWSGEPETWASEVQFATSLRSAADAGECAPLSLYLDAG